MSCGTKAYIDLNALSHNLARVRQIAKNHTILSMIKSNGYGHGLARVANALPDSDAFGVALLEEALHLRQQGVSKPIVVMSGFLAANDLVQFAQFDFIPVIHSVYQIELLEKAHLEKPLSVWIKMDTGMHRLGFVVEEFTHAMSRLQQCHCVARPINVMTHLADADNSDKTYTQQQLQEFIELTRALPGKKSIANSAGILAYPESLVDWVRPGIMLYGISPFADRTGVDENLLPVMTLVSKLMAVKSLKKGDAIGYGMTYRCPQDMLVGVVAIGYGDGYPRHAKSGTPTLIQGLECPLVGRVSMDMITVDLRNAPRATIGDEVVLWGRDLPIEKVAFCSETIGYELLCSVTKRVEFVES